MCCRDFAGLVALPEQACITETSVGLSPYLDRRVLPRLAGLVALPEQACVTETLRVLSLYLNRRVLPRPRGACRLTWTGVSETIGVQ